MNDLDIPPSWEHSAEGILSNGLRKVLVLGAADCGKSTYCQYLGHFLMNQGAQVAFVDADIGQKDIGPPAAITLGYLNSPGKLADIKPSRIYFVGAVSPIQHLLPMVVGTQKLVDSVRTPFVIINTTGLIHGLGRILKSYKIEAVKPDVIIAIERTHELKSLLRAYRNHKIFFLNCSSKAVPKTLEDRKIAREKAFCSYFQNADEITLNLKKTIFQRSLFFTGKVVVDPRFVYCEKSPEGLIGVSDAVPDPSSGTRVVRRGFEKNLLCGLADRKNNGIGLGIIKEINFVRETIRVLSPAPAERIRIVQLGDLYVASSGQELERKKPDDF